MKSVFNASKVNIKVNQAKRKNTKEETFSGIYCTQYLNNVPLVKTMKQLKLLPSNLPAIHWVRNSLKSPVETHWNWRSLQQVDSTIVAHYRPYRQEERYHPLASVYDWFVTNVQERTCEQKIMCSYQQTVCLTNNTFIDWPNNKMEKQIEAINTAPLVL